jgi:hypothetical protein
VLNNPIIGRVQAQSLGRRPRVLASPVATPWLCRLQLDHDGTKLGRIQKKMAATLVQRQNIVTKVLGSSVPSSRSSSSAGKILRPNFEPNGENSLRDLRPKYSDRNR